MAEDVWADAEVIYEYSREQALADGVLVDVTATAQEMGILYPVALTSAVWGLIERIPESRKHQDAAGRLWDVLWIARLSMLQHKHEATDTLRYRVILEHVDGGHLCRYVDLKIHVGPGDNWEPVITIMLPNED